MINIPICKNCFSKTNKKLRKLIMSDGRFHIFWLCLDCGEKAEGIHWVKQSIAESIMSQYGRTLDDIEVHKDNRERNVS